MVEEKKTKETEGKAPQEKKSAGPKKKEDSKRTQRGGRGGSRPRRRYDDNEAKVWTPRTDIGKKVQAGEITNIDEILEKGMPIMEEGIVDTLLPSLNEEVIDVRRVQRTLDSGRRMRFSVLSAVGDKNGHIGVGISKGVEAGPTIKKSITRAKLNIIRAPRSCASWECGCGEQHTVPYKITGKAGSVTMTIKPAPKGVGVVAGDNAKIILDFAGIHDAWVQGRGHTRTMINQVVALYNALKKVSSVKSDVSEKTKAKTKTKK